MAHQKAIIVGISGCSSSGKTTLARLLRDIFPNTFILHEDDFYKAEDQLPIKDGLVDWDCPEAISIPDMEKALTHIRSMGTFPVSLLALDTPTLSHRHDHGTQKPILWAGGGGGGGPAAGSSSSCHGPSPSSAHRSLSLVGGRRGAAAGIGAADRTATPIPIPPLSSPLSLSSSSSNPPPLDGSSSPLSSPPTSISSSSSSISTPSSSKLPAPQESSPTPNTDKDSSLTKPNTSPSAGSVSTPKQPEVDSKEDQNSVGESPVTAAQIAAAKQKVQEWLQPGQPGSRIFPVKSQPPTKEQGENSHHHHGSPHREPERTGPRICLLDGFLLYSPTHLPEKIMTTLLDIKLFLLVSRQKATQRREARDGYVTLEGFWTDPPGYVEKIVWPNYVEAHRWLFENGDVEKGVLNRQAMKKYGVLAQIDKGLDVPFGETLDWAVEMIQRELERIVLLAGEEKEMEKEDGGGDEGEK